MRLAIRLLGPALLLSVLAVGCASSPSNAPATGAVNSGAVSIKGFAFNPAQLSVTKGATVTWTNDDRASVARAANGALKSPPNTTAARSKCSRRWSTMRCS